MTKSKIFAISGSYSSGKTTVFHQSLGSFYARKIPIVGTRESARDVLYLLAKNRELPLHLEIAELKLISNVRALREDSIVLTDSGLTGNLAYFNSRSDIYHVTDPFLKKLIFALTQNCIAQYRHVFVTQIFYSISRNDVIRDGKNTPLDQIRGEIIRLLKHSNIPQTLYPIKNPADCIVKQVSKMLMKSGEISGQIN